jgi:tRNA threonylcarbamoyladenosine biosynthesis protein TsaE
MTKTISTNSESETAAVGRELAAQLSAGDVVLLYGDLGAGKTAFVKGLAEGLGVPRDDVSSPTFTIMQEYRGGRLPLFHVDLYRLDDPRELDDLGLEEITETGVLAIEWADKLTGDARLKPSRYGGAVVVRIEHGAETERRLTLAPA